MANIYIAQKGDRIDNITAKHYGSVKYTDRVLKENQHLVGKLVLDLGDEVILPKIEEPLEVVKGKALW